MNNVKFGVKLLLLAIISSCSSDSVNQKAEMKTNAPFFDFDKIVHIYILISEQQFNDLYMATEKSKKDKNLLNILTNPLTKNIAESTLAKDLEGVDKIETILDTNYYNELNTSVFVEKECNELAETACEPNYKDIFIFYKKEKITGIAKLDFNCSLYTFSGNNANYECFGSANEFGRLKLILKGN